MNGFIKTHGELTRVAMRITPASITFGGSTTDSLLSCFGKAEVEQNAGKLVRFFQMKEVWCPFKVAELEAFYEEIGWPTYRAHGIGIFMGLAGPWFDDGGMGNVREGGYIHLQNDGSCMITDKFILRCSSMHPDTIDALTREHAA